MKLMEGVHQGVILKNYLKGKGFRMLDVAKKLNMTEQGLSKNLRSEELSKSFVLKINEALGFNVLKIIKGDREEGNEQNYISEGDRLRLKKAIGEDTQELGLVYVPIAAQAGYSRNFEDPIYVNQLERLYVPGLPYKGDKFRYFDVEGDSMFPTLEEGMQVIAERVNQEDWKHVSDYYIYVVIKINKIRIKRLFRKSEEQFVLISDNDFVKQELINTEDILELWLVKRMLDWRMAPPKRVQIDL